MRIRRYAVGLTAVALGVAIAVTIGEVGVRLVAPQPLQHIQLDDQLYFVNRPFARFTYARQREYSVDVAYNAWGFRGPVPDSVPGPGVTRILLIGDSQTEGLQVRYEETYGQILQRSLERLLPERRFEVVNLAVSAYGTHQEVLTLRRYGDHVRPCWVVLGFFPGNDLSDNVRLPLVTEDTTGVRLIEHRFSLGHRLWLGTKVWLASASHLYTASVWGIKALLSQHRMSQAGLIEPTAPAVDGQSRTLRLTEQLILIARRDAESLGASLIVLVIPERSQVSHPKEAPLLSLDAVEHQFASWFDREAIQHIEALTALRDSQQRGQRPFFSIDGHLNAVGHQVVGEALADRMARIIHKNGERARCDSAPRGADQGRRLR